MSTVQTGVGAIFCAAHNDGYGRVHGHTYEVTAWFPAGDDAIELKRRLEDALRDFDHALLTEPWAERIAESLRVKLPDCLEIEIGRPLERLYVRSR